MEKVFVILLILSYVHYVYLVLILVPELRFLVRMSTEQKKRQEKNKTNQRYEQVPATVNPHKNDVYFVINDMNCKSMLKYEDGKWLDFDYFEGAYFETDIPLFWLKLIK